MESDGEGEGAECAEVDVPVHWTAPDGPKLQLFVKRVRGSQPGKRQLWMLSGGPGSPGTEFEWIAGEYASLDPELEIYLLDHRGTGRSSRLGCAVEEAEDSPGELGVTEAEWPACIAALEETWGDGLSAFTTTNAAKDLGFLIDATREPGQEVVVFGGSYGTFLAQRYLQLFPDQATAVALMGIVPPTVSFTEYDGLYNEVGKDYLNLCGADPLCASKLGPDPATRADELLAGLDEGHCPGALAAGFDREMLRELFGTLLLVYWEERVLIPAILYRLDRCAPDDVAAVTAFAELLSAPQPISIHDRLESPALGIHISLSELWSDPPPRLAEMEAVADAAAFSTGAMLGIAALQEAWPRYEPDELDGAWATTGIPMLMMNGTLDPASPLSRATLVGEHFDAPHQKFVTIEGAPHSFNSPTPAGTSCSQAMLLSFVRDPTAPDTSCLDDLLPVSFDTTEEFALAAFGTRDLWENLPSARAPENAPREREVRRHQALIHRATSSPRPAAATPPSTSRPSRGAAPRRRRAAPLRIQPKASSAPPPPEAMEFSWLLQRR